MPLFRSRNRVRCRPLTPAAACAKSSEKKSCKVSGSCPSSSASNTKPSTKSCVKSPKTKRDSKESKSKCEKLEPCQFFCCNKKNCEQPEPCTFSCAKQRSKPLTKPLTKTLTKPLIRPPSCDQLESSKTSIVKVPLTNRKDCVRPGCTSKKPCIDCCKVGCKTLERPVKCLTCKRINCTCQKSI